MSTMQFPKDLMQTGRTVQQLKMYPYSATKKLYGTCRSEYISFGSFNVDGFDWIVRYYPYHSDLSKDWLAFRLLPHKRYENEVKVTLQCQIIDENGFLPPFGTQCVTSQIIDENGFLPPFGTQCVTLICEDKLCSGIDVGTVATTLALVDQLNCSRLKERCIKFIVASLENLDAVMVIEGYKYLMASCPLVVNELLRAAMCYRR